MMVLLFNSFQRYAPVALPLPPVPLFSLRPPNASHSTHNFSSLYVLQMPRIPHTMILQPRLVDESDITQCTPQSPFLGLHFVSLRLFMRPHIPRHHKNRTDTTKTPSRFPHHRALPVRLMFLPLLSCWKPLSTVGTDTRGGGSGRGRREASVLCRRLDTFAPRTPEAERFTRVRVDRRALVLFSVQRLGADITHPFSSPRLRRHTYLLRRRRWWWMQ